MTVVVALLVGLVTVRFLRIVSGEILASPTLERTNYHGHTLATAGGLFIILTVLVIDAGRSVLGAHRRRVPRPGSRQARLAVLFAVFGFGFLGLIDDLAAVGEDRGFKGHLGALREGRVTTGLLKLVGGAAVAVVSWPRPASSRGARCIVDAVLIALAANLGNLLDRAPGRTIKFGLVAYVPIAIAIGTAPIGIAAAPVMGAALGLLRRPPRAADARRHRRQRDRRGARARGRARLAREHPVDGDARAARAERRRGALVVLPCHRRGATAPLVRPLGQSARAGRSTPH